MLVVLISDFYDVNITQDYRNNGILSYIQVGGKILYRTSDVQQTIMSGFKEVYRLRDSG
mgnify:FL=1